MKNKDIIVVGLQPWDDESIGSNCKNIAAEFSKHNRVLYINPPLDRISIKRHRNNPLVAKRINIIKSREENLVKINDNMWMFFPSCILESANWIPFTPLFRMINKINNKRFAKQIQTAIKKLKFRNYILFNDSDMFRSYHLKEMIQPALNIYYTRDNLMGVPYWFKHGKKFEPELFAKSDLVTANSPYLADVARKYNKHSYYVGQGCDTADFDLSKVKNMPADIAHINSPVIGFIGVLNILRLDIELLENIASQKKEWNIILIGPQDEAFKNSKLHRMDNVFLLGQKDAKDLPAYLAAFDVAINPQIVNEVTVGNYPRKIDEYLAMGKPVVATETKAMDIFKDYAYLAKTKEDYILLIEKALAENNIEKEKARIMFAQSHTWQNSVSEIYKAIGNVKPEFV